MPRPTESKPLLEDSEILDCPKCLTQNEVLRIRLAPARCIRCGYRLDPKER